MKRFLIDGNSIGYKLHCGTKLTTNGFETQAIFGFIKAMRTMFVENPKCSELVLWDGVAQWRYDIFPNYKADRDKDPKQELMRANYKKARPFVQKCLQYLGVRQLTHKLGEADDMAGYMVSALNPDDEIELQTGDGDWIQLVRENVSWYDSLTQTRINAGNLFETTGYKNGYAFLEGKAFQGDSSDKIPPVGGIGEKTAPLFLAQFGTTQKFFEQVDSGLYVPKKKYEVNLANKGGDERAKYHLNMKLMNLLDVPKPEAQDIEMVKGGFDKEKFRIICERLNFVSILTSFDNFISPFERRL